MDFLVGCDREVFFKKMKTILIFYPGKSYY